jgi:hypothetical protein
MEMRKTICIFACLFTINANAAVIDTSAGLTGLGIAHFGETNTATYGQTFTVTGPETVLESFSFRFDDLLDSDFVDFAAYLYEWDGGKAIGPELYSSGMLNSTNNAGLDGMELFTFNTGGIALLSGTKYVAFLSASQFFDGQEGTSGWDLSASDIYSGGEMVFDNNGSNFDDLFGSDWDSYVRSKEGRDTFFVARFVPEPASLTLIIFCLGIFSLLRKKCL